MCGTAQFLARLQNRLPGIGQGAIVALLNLERQLRQWLGAQQANQKYGDQQDAEKSSDVENSTQPLPAFTLRIVEDLFVH